MLRKQGLALVAAACAAIAGSQLAHAAGPVTAGARAPLLMDDMAPANPTTNPVTATPTTTAPAAPGVAPSATPGTTPLMGLLEAVGVGHPLEDAGISVTGFVEGSYTLDFSNPPGHIIPDRAFDTRSNSIALDQVELNVQRTVDYGKPFDFGAQLEQIYGTDSPYIHSNGLTIYSLGKTAAPFAGAGDTATIHPKAQYDLTQANFTISSNAVGKGIAFEGGKFATLLGAELIDAYSASSTNAFYSHSFIFLNEPYTHTGALGILNFNEQLTFTGGITRGWDQATEDTNGNIDFLGQLKDVVNTQTTFYLTGITGNEEPDVPAGEVGHNGYRTVIDAVGNYNASDQLSLSANLMYAWEAQTGNAGNGGGLGQWYAAAAYASYKFDSHVTFNARGEWFNDPDGAAPSQFSPMRGPNEYYEATLGLTLHPLPDNAILNNLFFRPEVRFDYADHADFDTVNGLPTNHYFFTFAVDGVYAF